MITIKKRRFKAIQQSLAIRDRPRPGRCNYPIDQGKKFCKLSAGKFTAHPGSGYCKKHDTTSYDPIARYRGIKQKNIRSQLRELLKKESDAFDLTAEIYLMRGLMIDYVERHMEFKEALLAWYRDGKMKPKGVVDIADAIHHIEAISRMIERYHRIQRSGSIDLDTFARATELMGIVVAKYVRDGKILQAIETDWAAISLDNKSTLALPPAPTAELAETATHAKD